MDIVGPAARSGHFDIKHNLVGVAACNRERSLSRHTPHSFFANDNYFLSDARNVVPKFAWQQCPSALTFGIEPCLSLATDCAITNPW